MMDNSRMGEVMLLLMLDAVIAYKYMDGQKWLHPNSKYHIPTYLTLFQYLFAR